MPSNYNYHVPNANDPHPPTTADRIFDELSADKMKEVCDRVWQDENRKRAQEAQPQEIEKFLQLCPDFDNTDSSENANGQLMVVDLRLRGLDHSTATAEDLRESWDRVKVAGLPVKLNKRFVREEQEREVAEGVKEIKERESFDEGEAYSMPLDRLRMRASGIR